MAKNPLLFYRESLLLFLEQQKQKIADCVAGIIDEKLQSDDHDDLCDELVERFRLRVPVLDESQKSWVDSDETIHMWYQGENQDVPGINIKYTIPFMGKPDLFQYKPNHFSTVFPHADVNGTQIIFDIWVPGQNPEEHASRFTEEINLIKKYLDWVKIDVDKYNDSLKDYINGQIDAKAKSIKGKQGFKSDLDKLLE